MEKELVGLIEHLLLNSELVLLGFELNFDHDDLNLQSAIEKLKADRFNYPFIMKHAATNKVEIFVGDEIDRNLDLLNLLKEKTHPVFEMIR